jgi:hypothetical protein
LTTLKQFEEALRVQGMHMAPAILEKLRKEDKKNRTITPARRVAGKKMTSELARRILELHNTTDMTQQEIAFELGVNQGRVNEVIKRGKWLTEDPNAPEAVARDKAKERMARAESEPPPQERPVPVQAAEAPRQPTSRNSAQLTIEDLLNGLVDAGTKSRKQ